MVITNSAISFVFPRNERIRREALHAEEQLADFLDVPLQILPIPDDAPQNLARATGKSKGGHSSINISQIGIDLKTNFDGAFPHDWQLCKNYLSDKATKIFPIASKISDNRVIHVGVVVDVLFPCGVGESRTQIVDRILKLPQIPESLIDIGAKLTFELEGKFYLNYIIESQKTYQTNVIGDGRLSVLDPQPQTESVLFRIDINDKLVANFDADYVSTLDTFMRIIDFFSDIFEVKIERLYNSGEWE
jgi:hypothetical protein